MAATINELLPLMALLIIDSLFLTLVAQASAVNNFVPINSVVITDLANGTQTTNPIDLNRVIWIDGITGWLSGILGDNTPDFFKILVQILVFNISDENIIPLWVNILAIKLPECGIAAWILLAIRG